MGGRIFVKNTSNPAKAAHELLRKTLVHDNKIRIPIDVFEVAKQLDIEVLRLPLEDGTDGLLVKRDANGKFQAVIDAGARAHRARFTLAHEIGHFIKDYQEPSQDVVGIVQRRNEMSSTGEDPDEVWANRFAANLLMPDNIVNLLWADNVPAEEIADMLDVSMSSFGHKLESLGLV